MAVRLHWRGLLIVAAALTLLSACAVGGASHPIAGATATTGPVTVTTNLPTYTTGDAVGATVTNSSTTDFYAQDGQSACTIVQVEQYNGKTGAWTPVDACHNGQTTQILVVAQGTAVPYTLAPTSASDVNAWQPGTYRISITYSTQADGVTSPQVAHSAAFKVTS